MNAFATSPQLPLIDTFVRFENVRYSITLEKHTFLDVLNMGLEVLLWRKSLSWDSQLITGVIHNFIQPQEYYLKDIKLGVNSEYVIREIEQYRMYNGHCLTDSENYDYDGDHIRALIERTLLNPVFMSAAVTKGFTRDPRAQNDELLRQNKRSKRSKAPWMRRRNSK